MQIGVSQLDGAHRGRTEQWDGPSVRIGTDPEAEVCLGDAAGVLPVHATIETDGREAYLRPCGPIRLNRRPAGEAVLKDGDLLEVGEETVLRIHLHPQADDTSRAYHALVASAARSGASARSPGGAAVATAATVFFLLLMGGAYLLTKHGSGSEELDSTLRRAASRQRRALDLQRRSYEGTVESLRTELEDLARRTPRRDEVEQRVGQVQRAMSEVESSVLRRVTTEIAPTRAVVRKMARDDDAMERIIASHSGAVCLIQGSYGFGRMEKGEWRFLREASDEILADLEISDEKVPLMLDGTGPLFKVDYTGTGFLVDAKGVVLTNHHIAEPWWRSEAAEPLLEDGFEPRFHFLRAYFPGRRKPVPFDLARMRISKEADLAALAFNPRGKLPEPLRLSPLDAIAPGRRVLLLGYPSGLNALIARTDDRFAREIAKRKTFDPKAILDQLARKGMVRPLPSQGYIGDILETKVLFDAPTAVGGSGGPLVDMDGNVVAVNYGILKSFRGANFGVPIRYARRLLGRR